MDADAYTTLAAWAFLGRPPSLPVAKLSCPLGHLIGHLTLRRGPVASADFMEGIEDLPVQERER